LVFEDEGRHVGVVLGSVVHDVGSDLPDVASALALGSSDLARMARKSPVAGGLADLKLLPPVDSNARIFCLALNYRAHADESGGADPERPLIFHKLDTSLIGPYDEIVTPRHTEFLDYEAELAIVMGYGRRSGTAEGWRGAIGGYTILNDVSCRDAPPTKVGDALVVDWFSAKEADATTPVGPWVVPADQVADPHELRITLRRNGEVLQDAPTSLMIFHIPSILDFITERVTLRAGDIVSTGTPGGVGKGRGIRLLPGDVIETEISGIGGMRNLIAGSRPAIAPAP
jgi:2-keto-4-pentenoate hydratase/2-oxohepta-3-ene-1,7-dioic acid hydratase in catechol pathway